MEVIGLFGFVFLKPILKPKLWLFVMIISIVFSLIYEFITELDLREGMTDFDYYLYYVIGLVLYLPAYYGLYKYSQPTDPAWNQ